MPYTSRVEPTPEYVMKFKSYETCRSRYKVAFESSRARDADAGIQVAKVMQLKPPPESPRGPLLQAEINSPPFGCMSAARNKSKKEWERGGDGVDTPTRFTSWAPSEDK